MLPGLSYACTCRYWRLPEDEQIRLSFEQSSLVVLVRVTEVELEEGLEAARNRISGKVSIIEAFKSSKVDLRQLDIKIVNPQYASSCGEGASPQTDDYMLLYLQSTTITEEDFTHCSRSRILKSDAEASAELAVLRKLASLEGQLLIQAR
jgi:hypothetical protein